MVKVLKKSQRELSARSRAQDETAQLIARRDADVKRQAFQLQGRSPDS